MPDPRPMPLPGWLLAGEFLATALLGSGLLIRFDAGVRAGLGLPEGLAPALIGLGAIGIVASTFALFRHVSAIAASRKPR